MTLKFITVPTICPVCHDQVDFTLEEEKVERWRNGELIQVVFPELSIQDRERLISGMCPKCWDSMFKEDDDA